MTNKSQENVIVAPSNLSWFQGAIAAAKPNVGLLLGPLAAAFIWLIPTGLEPVQQKALAITAFMIVYWIAEPIDHGLTALIGIYLFWALEVAKFPVAFSGFVNSTTWFLFSSLLMAEAAARTGLAKRVGLLLMSKSGSSATQILAGLLSLSFMLTFFVPSGMGRIAILMPLTAGIVKASGLSDRSNVAKGFFVVLTAFSGLVGRDDFVGCDEHDDPRDLTGARGDSRSVEPVVDRVLAAESGDDFYFGGDYPLALSRRNPWAGRGESIFPEGAGPVRSMERGGKKVVAMVRSSGRPLGYGFYPPHEPRCDRSWRGLSCCAFQSSACSTEAP